MTRFALAVALFLASATRGVAGIADSPLPGLLPGAVTQHLYSVPGVINGGGLGTFFSCTSTDAVPVQVGVEVFGFAGGAAINDPVATSLSLPPGGTFTFGTSAAVGLSVSSTLSPGPVSKGSARILATSKKVVCTAFIADTTSAPPIAGWQLTIIAKTKQKAAN